MWYWCCPLPCTHLLMTVLVHLSFLPNWVEDVEQVNDVVLLPLLLEGQMFLQCSRWSVKYWTKLCQNFLTSQRQLTDNPLWFHGIDMVSATITTICPWVDLCYWSRRMSMIWQDHMVLKIWGEERWAKNFRMRKQTLLEVWVELAPTLQCQTTLFWKAMPVQKYVGVALWKLASC